MRKSVLVLLLVVFVCLVPATVFAALSGDPVKQYGLPMLLTNAGQGGGGKQVRTLIGQARTITLDVDFWYNSEPWEADLKARPYKVLMPVIGSTDKGLGASGITIDQEISRLTQMVGWAKNLNIPMVAVIIEADKRSNIKTNPNERCIDLICPAADSMIMLKAAANFDSKITNYAKQNNIPLTIIDTAFDFMTAVIPQMFGNAK